jgi:hypothetical protein
MPTARFEADFSGFISAINGAQMKLVDFNKGAETVETTLNDMTDKFSGRALIQEASLMTIAIEKIGGVSKLTADELEQVGTKANDAVAKLQAMGSDVPAGLQKLADATKANADASDEWSGALKLLETGLSAIGVTASMTAVINWLKSIGTEAAELTNMAARLQTTTSEVQKFQVAAESTGVPMSTMVSAMQTLQEKIGKGGDAGLTQAFADLHLSMDQLKDQSLFTNMQQIGAALQGISDKNKEAADAQEIFGRGWKELLPVINSNLAETTGKVTEMSTTTVSWFDQMNTHAKETQTSWTNTAANILHNIGTLTPEANALKDSLAAMSVPKLPPLFEPGKIPAITGDLDAMIQAGNDMTAAIGDSPAWAKWKQAVIDVDAQTADWHKTLDGLDGTIVDGAEHLLELGVNAKTVQSYFQLSDEAMIALQKDIKEGGPAIEAAFKAADDATGNWQTTLAGLSGEVQEGIKYYLSLGLTVQQVQLIMQQSVPAIDAVKDSIKAQHDAALSIQKIWNDYTDIVGSGSETAYEKATAAIDKWYADDIAKHQQSKTDTAAYYDAVAALDDAKYAHLATNRLAEDKDSKLHLDNQAKADAEAYQFALANLDQFSQAHIQKLRDTADASALAAASWGTAWGDAGTAAAGGVDTVTAAVQKTATAVYALGQAGSAGEQQAMSAALAEVNASNIGQMMKSGTTNVDTMNAYEAAIEQAMASRGYSVGGGLTPAAQNAGYGGTSVNTTVNVNTPLGTPSQISSAVSSALSSSLRQSGVMLPSQ